jgi:hypothetical protein
MSDSFHKSLYGRFGERLPSDADGYVHLTAAAWLAAPVDTAGATMTEEQAAALASQAREATRDAQDALREWKSRN